MSKPTSPFEAQPPSARRLVVSIGLAILVALAVLLTAVLPAEYGIDPTGLGKALGLTTMHAPKRTLQVKDVVGGNESYRQVALPDPGDPFPLPNPAVAQVKPVAALSRTITVTLQPEQKTEIKAILGEAQVVLYSWSAEGGEVYTDFHGHEPDGGYSFVRYEEQQTGHEGHGSLVAPFAGEHGWFWLNISDTPVTITLNVSGYYTEIKDYGIIR